MSESGLEAPKDPGDAVHLVVGETLQLGVHADRVFVLEVVDLFLSATEV